MTFFNDVPRDARATCLLAHGAGAGMDTPFMDAIAQGLCAEGIAVARFEFAYMASRHDGGSRRPPPRADKLIEEYRNAILSLDGDIPLFIGGKSLGGRVASMIAEEEFRAGRAAGLVCLGYPFHPPGSPEKLRTDHLKTLAAPAIFVQGERDPFGGREEVAGYGLPREIEVCWARDGDHDLKPRRRSGVTWEENLQHAVLQISAWIERMI